MTQRKGARRIAEIPNSILEQLNRGQLETANLIESLAIDFGLLLQSTFSPPPPALIAQLEATPGQAWLQKMRLVSQGLYEHYGDQIIDRLLSHPADTVRGWAAGVIGLIPDLPLDKRLARLRPLADDPHFGVRETAWLLVRQHIVEDILTALQLFQDWVKDASPNIRRFAIESTRPRGVWCSHINLLKIQPELGLPLLTSLHADPSRYVQNSVANWLNDAAKSKPDWVQSVCEQWRSANDSTATAYICKRALRTINLSA